MSAKLGVDVGYVLGAHNNMVPVVHPLTGETMHLIGFQGELRDGDHLTWKVSRLYAGAMCAVRTADQTYGAYEVNGPYAPPKPVLVTPGRFTLWRQLALRRQPRRQRQAFGRHGVDLQGAAGRRAGTERR